MITNLMETKNLLLITLIVLFLFLRLYQLPQTVNFSMDQGKTLLKIYQLWQEKKLTLIGPESSIKTLNGRTFFHGPWIYYFLLPELLITKWNPLAGSYFFIILNLLALILLFQAVKEKFGLRVAFLTSLFFSSSPQMIYFSQFSWNPNFLPFVSSLIIFFLVKIDKKPRLIYFFLTGFCFGFGLGCHYQALLLNIATLIFLILKRVSFKSLIALFFGFLLGFSPLIIFEFKHNFYNLRTILLILQQGNQKAFSWPLPSHYFLSFFPFLFLGGAIILERILKKSYLVGLGIILIFITYSLYQIIPQPESGFTMPKGWNYLGIKKAAKIIIQENKKNWNIVSLLSGDTRVYPLRYLLTVAQKPPLDVNRYPQAEYLFVISQHNKEKTINNPVWEISSFCPCKLTKSWEIQNNIKLYLLKKAKS